MPLTTMEDVYICTNGVRLHTVIAGPQVGPLAVLLHGFPEFWYGWRAQIMALSDAGYRVLVPDQRGYNLSDKPKGLRAYAIDELANDVLGLIDASGREKALLVGHDWGAAVAWWTALKYPQKLEKLVAINVPHPQVMQQTLRSNIEQLFRSWYIFFFQLPYLPEALARRNDWQMVCRALTSTSRPGTFSEADLQKYRGAWSQPDAYTSMLNWYRAALKYPAKLENPLVSVPTMLIWGAKDKFLSSKMAGPSIKLCKQGKLVLVEEATHWVHHEEPKKVNELVLSFFS